MSNRCIYKTDQMKLENNWKNKTLEVLEKDFWNESEHMSHLVSTCHKLRKKQLKDFNIEDLRIMLGQSIGLNFLIPIAIEKLQQNILVGGDFYEGDLLANVLTSEIDYWKREKNNWETICTLFKENHEKLNEFETTESIRREWFELFENFEQINGKL